MALQKMSVLEKEAFLIISPIKQLKSTAENKFYWQAISKKSKNGFYEHEDIYKYIKTQQKRNFETIIDNVIVKHKTYPLVARVELPWDYERKIVPNKDARVTQNTEKNINYIYYMDNLYPIFINDNQIKNYMSTALTLILAMLMCKSKDA